MPVQSCAHAQEKKGVPLWVEVELSLPAGERRRKGLRCSPELYLRCCASFFPQSGCVLLERSMRCLQQQMATNQPMDPKKERGPKKQQQQLLLCRRRRRRRAVATLGTRGGKRATMPGTTMRRGGASCRSCPANFTTMPAPRRLTSFRRACTKGFSRSPSPRERSGQPR